jgi:hypothetical protein
MKSLFQPDVVGDVERRLNTLQPESDARWGRMTSHQAVGHLADSFRMVLGECTMDERSPLVARTVFRFLLATLPMAWMKSASNAAALDQERGGTAHSEFQADVDELTVLMRRFAAAVEGGIDPHPFFGNLSRGEWGRWAYRHMDHPLTQFGV